MADWLLIFTALSSVASVLGLFLPRLLPARISPQRDEARKSSKRVVRVPVPKRFPLRSPSGHTLLTDKRVLQMYGWERLGLALNLGGAVFGLGLLFMVWELMTNPGVVLTVTCYGECQVGLNGYGLLFLFFIPLGIELIGGAIVSDARSRTRSEPWIVVRGERLAWAGFPRTAKVRAVLTQDEKELLERLEEEENQ